jgi:TPP-dependent pyruvate/acetoin dehydrogenase alpha subunit
MPQQMPLKDKQNRAAAGSVSSAPAESAPAHDGFSLISNQKLLELYATMLKCRLLDERIRVEHARLAKSEDGIRHIPLPAKGREAALVGVLIDMMADDTLSAPALDLLPQFVKGTPLVNLLRLLRQPIASSFQAGPSKSGAASAVAANRAKANKRIGVVLSGAAEQASWTDALRAASLHHLPNIFVSWKPRKIPALNIPVMTVDACDVVAVYRVASESIAHARQGFGPTLIECRQWDGPGATRSPILNMEKYLDRKGLFNKATKAEIATGFGVELDAAVAEALILPRI